MTYMKTLNKIKEDVKCHLMTYYMKTLNKINVNSESLQIINFIKSKNLTKT